MVNGGGEEKRRNPVQEEKKRARGRAVIYLQARVPGQAGVCRRIIKNGAGGYRGYHSPLAISFSPSRWIVLPFDRARWLAGRALYSRKKSFATRVDLALCALIRPSLPLRIRIYSLLFLPASSLYVYLYVLLAERRSASATTIHFHSWSVSMQASFAIIL